MRARLTVAGVMIALALLFLSHRDASAHADLVRSDPGPQSILGHPPQSIRLWFTETVELALTRIVVTDAKGAVQATDAPLRENSDPNSARGDLQSTLPAGTFTVTWSTVALDGHPSRGKFTFRVLGVNETVDSAFAAEADAQQDSATRAANTRRASALDVQSDEAQSLSTTEPLRVGARAIAYIAMICIIGAAGMRLFVLPRVQGLDTSSTRNISAMMAMFASIAAIVRILVGLLRLYIQPVLLGGLPTTDLAYRWAMVRTTDWGSVWLIQFVAAVVALVGFAIGGGKRKSGWMLAGLASVALAVGTAQQSHAEGSAQANALGIAVDSVHMLAISMWIGGLLWVVTVGFANVSRGDSLVRAWAPSSIAAALLAVLTGFVSAFTRVHSTHALTGTSYGTTLLTKIVLSVILIGVSARSWSLAASSRDDARSRGYGGWASAELLLGLVIIVVTSVLVGLPTPKP